MQTSLMDSRLTGDILGRLVIDLARFTQGGDGLMALVNWKTSQSALGSSNSRREDDDN